MKTRDEKIADLDARLKRWLTRGQRAQNAINKLLKQQARLRKPAKVERVMQDVITLAKDGSAIVEDLGVAHIPNPLPRNMMESGPDPFDDGGKSHSLKNDDSLDVPAFLQRTQADVDAMRAERLAEEAAAKLKMPLSGRDAMKAVRRKTK